MPEEKLALKGGLPTSPERPKYTFAYLIDQLRSIKVETQFAQIEILLTERYEIGREIWRYINDNPDYDKEKLFNKVEEITGYKYTTLYYSTRFYAYAEAHFGGDLKRMIEKLSEKHGKALTWRIICFEEIPETREDKNLAEHIVERKAESLRAKISRFYRDEVSRWKKKIKKEFVEKIIEEWESF